MVLDAGAGIPESGRNFTNDEHFLWLLRRVLTRYGFEPDSVWVSPSLFARSNQWHVRLWTTFIDPLLRSTASAKFGGLFLRRIDYDPIERELGQDWPLAAETMIGLRRMENLHESLETLEREGILGDYLEAGVWRGGAGIYMAAFLQILGIDERRVFLADSFDGLPKPDARFSADDGDVHWTKSFLSVGLAEVKKNFSKYGVSLERVRFLEGFFSDTLPNMEAEKIALLRLDGDMYSSTMDVLTNTWNKVVPGGIVIVDDWHLQARQAVEDFLGEQFEQVDVQPIDNWSVFFRKPSTN